MSSKARVETANIVKQITVRKQVIVRLFCSDINIDITFGQLFSHDCLILHQNVILGLNGINRALSLPQFVRLWPKARSGYGQV